MSGFPSPPSLQGAEGLLPLVRLYTQHIADLWHKAVLLFGYRLTLHPLNKYPGPFFAKILDGYGGLYAAARRLHLVTYENHVKYGQSSADINEILALTNLCRPGCQART